MTHPGPSGSLAIGFALTLLLAAGTASAGPIRLLLETDEDAGSNNEVFISSFDTFDDLVNSPPGGGAGVFSGININSAYSVGGLAYDGMYRLLLETDADSGSGTEVFISSFASFDDLVNSPPGGGAGAFSGININPAYDVRGFIYDGMYRLLLETIADSGSGAEVFISSFATFDELVNSPAVGGAGTFSGININSAYSVGGLAYDGMYRLLLETDADSGSGTEVFLSSFATFDDLVNSPPGGGAGTFSGININSAYSVGGLAYEFDPTPGVPVPSSIALLGLGLLGLTFAGRGRRQRRGRGK